MSKLLELNLALTRGVKVILSRDPDDATKKQITIASYLTLEEANEQDESNREVLIRLTLPTYVAVNLTDQTKY
jgi:hypothetical protein